MSDRLVALKLFVRVARTGSFSKGGRALKLSQPSASRLIAWLERDVGVALFSRTTRLVTMTEAGKNYLARVEPILASLEQADHEARGTGELRGILRVGLSSSFAIREVIPRLPKFTKRHPGLEVQLFIQDQQQDLLTNGIDVALRLGPLTDSTAVAKLVGVWARVLVASPAYLAGAGPLRTPTNLALHAVITGPMSVHSSWSFRRNGRLVSVEVKGRMLVSTNEGALAAAAAGFGIAPSSLGACRTEIESGVLVRVLAEWSMGLVEVHALYPGGKAAAPAARAFGNFLAAEFREQRATEA